MCEDREKQMHACRRTSYTRVHSATNNNNPLLVSSTCIYTASIYRHFPQKRAHRKYKPTTLSMYIRILAEWQVSYTHTQCRLRHSKPNSLNTHSMYTPMRLVDLYGFHFNSRLLRKHSLCCRQKPFSSVLAHKGAHLAISVWHNAQLVHTHSFLTVNASTWLFVHT